MDPAFLLSLKEEGKEDTSLFSFFLLSFQDADLTSMVCLGDKDSVQLTRKNSNVAM